MSAPESNNMDLPAIKRKVWQTSRIRTYEYLSREATVYAAIDAAYPWIKRPRDEAVRDLIKRWREAASGAPESDVHLGMQLTVRQCADELERAIGGGDA